MSGTAERSQKLVGKVAVVTGGARGIGGAIAAALAAEGADVVIADVLARSPPPGRHRRDRAAPDGASLYVHTDVTDDAQIEAMVARGRGRVRAHRHPRQQRRRRRSVPIPTS